MFSISSQPFAVGIIENNLTTVNATTVLPGWLCTCRLVSVLHRKLYVQDICFCFLRRCLPAVYQQLCTAREHASVQLSGLYNCSWINEAAIVHLLVLLFFVCLFLLKIHYYTHTKTPRRMRSINFSHCISVTRDVLRTKYRVKYVLRCTQLS